MARGDSMSPEKRALTHFIHEHLPPLLEKHGGQMKKADARLIIEAEFKKRYGWPAVLDGEAWNAWGWALNWLYHDGKTHDCTGKSDYELIG